MKVVLFCGGLGTRLREHSDTIPKPLVNVGDRPILWHLMRYYAHYGHKDFILCLGYRGDLIREFFLNYRAAMSTDFVLSDGGRRHRAARAGHRGLAHHLRRHGPALEPRRAAAAGQVAARGRGGIPRQLFRRTHATCRWTSTSTQFRRSGRPSRISSSVRPCAELPRCPGGR